MGGMVEAIERGFPQREIAESAYRFQQAVDRKDRIIVGVNDYLQDDDGGIETLYIDESVEETQRKRLADLKQRRDDDRVRDALARVAREAADPVVNLMPALIDAVNAWCTEGELVHTLEGVFGTYTEPAMI